MSLFAVTLIIVLILVVGPILYWILRGLYRSSIAVGEERDHVPPRTHVLAWHSPA
jgi:hypothetical protein